MRSLKRLCRNHCNAMHVIDNQILLSSVVTTEPQGLLHRKYSVNVGIGKGNINRENSVEATDAS